MAEPFKSKERTRRFYETTQGCHFADSDAQSFVDSNEVLIHIDKLKVDHPKIPYEIILETYKFVHREAGLDTDDETKAGFAEILRELVNAINSSLKQ